MGTGHGDKSEAFLFEQDSGRNRPRSKVKVGLGHPRACTTGDVTVTAAAAGKGRDGQDAETPSASHSPCPGIPLQQTHSWECLWAARHLWTRGAGGESKTSCTRGKPRGYGRGLPGLQLLLWSDNYRDHKPELGSNKLNV